MYLLYKTMRPFCTLYVSFSPIQDCPTLNIICICWRAVMHHTHLAYIIIYTSIIYLTIYQKLAKKFTDSQNPTWKNNTSIYQFKFNSIMEEDTLKMLQNLPSSNNIDVLGFDSLLLNLSSDVIYSSLTVLFNMSLNTGQIPDDWKKARVTPIFKNKGSNTGPNNYRPISVIGHIPKCFEKMVDVQFREYLLAHAFITQSQSAFIKHHSTQTSLHHVIDSF